MLHNANCVGGMHYIGLKASMKCKSVTLGTEYVPIFKIMEKEITKKYTNGAITVVWRPGMCIHSTICWKQATGLPEVFNPREKPWIKMEGADSAHIAAQVEKCPSGALRFFYNEEVE